MSHPNVTPVSVTSADILADRLEALRELIPEAFAEDRIDFAKLRTALGDVVDDRPERYSFTWAGKRDAIRLLQAPTTATLIPAKDESLDWDTTQHLFIEGDNLEVLKLLYKAYYGRVKMIYIDPPYNTGNDFIYPDNYADPLAPYLQLTGQMDAAGTLLTSNPETSGRYHSAWLSMMYPRMFIARQLLRDDGVIFVSIDDREAHNLRSLLNEIFGEEQFVADIAVVNNLKGRSDKQYIATAHERLMMYAKSAFVSQGLRLDENKLAEFDQFDEKGRKFQWRDLRKRGGADSRKERPNLFFPLYLCPTSLSLSMKPTSETDIAIFPLKSDRSEGCWRWGYAKVAAHVDQLQASYVPASDRWNISYRVYLEVGDEQRTAKPKSAWIGPQYSTDLGQRALKELLPGVDFGSPPKAVGQIREILEQSSDSDDICLDFFAGSATTAQALLELNRNDSSQRQFILIQLPEPIEIVGFRTIADIGKERIRRVVARMKADTAGQLDLSTRDTPEDLGFRVFKLAPSHFAGWTGTAQPTPGEYVNQLELFAEPLHSRWDPEAVVWEIAIKEGFSLASRVETAAVASHVVYRVTDADRAQSFHVCLDDQVNVDIVAALHLGAEDLFVCRDTALDDTAAANLALSCRLKTI